MVSTTIRSPSGKASGAIEAAASVDPVKAIENDREFKAHIYQQLVDLQPYLPPESQIAVMVHLEQDEETAVTLEYSLTLVTTLGDYKLEAEGRDANLYGAVGLAKQNMLAQLDEVLNAAIDSNERDEEIQNLIEGGLTLH